MTDEERRDGIRKTFEVIREHLGLMEAECIAKGGTVDVDVERPVLQLPALTSDNRLTGIVPGPDFFIRIHLMIPVEIRATFDAKPETWRDKEPLL